MRRWGIPLLLCLLLAGCSKTAAESARQRTEAAIDGYKIEYAVCEDPVYTVRIWQQPETWESAPLYVATLPVPEDIAKKRQELPSETAVPLATFTTIGDSDYRKEDVGCRFWLPVVAAGQIWEFYYLSSPVHGGWTMSVGEADALNAMAAMTSAEEPLYLVLSGDFLYGVIGDTAWYLSDWNEENAPSNLPELYLGEGEVQIETIQLTNKRQD